MAKAKYPHMRKPEQAVWERALNVLKFPEGTYYIYDMHLGNGMPLRADWPEWVQRMATALTQRRVDAVAVAPNGIFIIEVKIRADAGGIGQLLLYRQLYVARFGVVPEPKLIMVAGSASFDLAIILAELGINLVIA